MKVSVILHTAREEPHIEGILQDLRQGTFPGGSYEIVVVDPLQRNYTIEGKGAPTLVRAPVISTLMTDHKKVAISAYKMSGLVLARGELVVSIDDCSHLGPTFLEECWEVYAASGVCLAASIPEEGWRDQRLMTDSGWVDQRMARPEEVFGFRCFPLDAALEVNGPDLAYDGARRLEDMDEAVRLAAVGVRFALWRFDGLRLLRPKGPLSPTAIDPVEPVVGCCNRAWQVQQGPYRAECELPPRGPVVRANVPSLWEPSADGSRQAISALLGPCRWLAYDQCLHYTEMPTLCPYVHQRWTHEPHPVGLQLHQRPPIFDLARARKDARQ